MTILGISKNSQVFIGRKRCRAILRHKSGEQRKLTSQLIKNMKQQHIPRSELILNNDFYILGDKCEGEHDGSR